MTSTKNRTPIFRSTSTFENTKEMPKTRQKAGFSEAAKVGHCWIYMLSMVNIVRSKQKFKKYVGHKRGSFANSTESLLGEYKSRERRAFLL
ncbi:hypothetical protein FF2_001865 [Malus domestica]